MNTEIPVVENERGVEKWNSSLTKVIWSAASKTIPKKEIPQRGTMVPWWNEECNSAV